MLKRILVGMSFIGIIGFFPLAQAAIFTFSLSDMAAPSGFEAFVMNLNVSSDFNYITDTLTFGSAVPSGTGSVVTDSKTPSPEVILDWAFANNNPIVTGNTFTIDAFNGDALDITPSAMDGSSLGMPGKWIHTADGLYSENNLLNGILFNFEYEGTINALSLFRVGLSTGAERTLDDLVASGIKYEVDFGGPIVPIPSSLLLLGGGLCALIGVNRKKK